MPKDDKHIRVVFVSTSPHSGLSFLLALLIPTRGVLEGGHSGKHAVEEETE